MSFRLGQQQSIDSNAAQEAHRQLGGAIELLETQEPTDVDERVHKVRKRIKKARALIRLMKDSVGKKAVAKVNHRLRDASRPLSSVRDASALLSTLDRLEQRSVGLVALAPFDEARLVLEAHLAEIRREVLEEGDALALVLERLRSARRRMARWETETNRRGSISGVGQAFKRGKQAFQTAKLDPTSDNLHELRKRAKALGYQIKVVGGDEPTPLSNRARLLSGLLADELGEGHDLDILRQFLEAQPRFDPIVKAIDRRRIDLRQGALQRAGVIFQARTKAFVRSLKSKEWLASGH